MSPRQSRVRARYGGLPGNAACSSDASPVPWLMVRGRDSPRNPPLPPTGLSSLWAGTVRKRASETQHPENGERQGGGETELNGVRVSERLEKVYKDISLIRLFGF